MEESIACGRIEVEEASADNQCHKSFLASLENISSECALDLIQNASTVDINTTDELGIVRALLIMAIEGHFEACQALLDRDDFDGVNAHDTIHSNALHFAAGNDHVEICKLLLANPRFTGTVNTKNKNDRTPLDFAREFGDGDALPVLQAACSLHVERENECPQTESNTFTKKDCGEDDTHDTPENEAITDMAELD